MINFEYLEPKSAEEVVGYLKKYGDEAKIKAAGISLLLLLKQGFFAPKYLVNLSGLKDLDYIKLDKDSNLLLGALTTHRDIELSRTIKENFVVLSHMEEDLGSVQIRNRGTIGGCLCHGDPLIDPPAPLIALKARARVLGPEGTREIPFEDFFVDYYETALSPQEILTEIIVPKIPPNSSCSYIKHTMRKAMDKPFVGASVFLTFDDDGRTCKDARVIVAAISPVPVRAKSVEEKLIGEKIDDSSIEQAVKLLDLEDIDYTFDIRCPQYYKKWTTPVMVKRAIGIAVKQAKDNS